MKYFLVTIPGYSGKNLVVAKSKSVARKLLTLHFSYSYIPGIKCSELKVEKEIRDRVIIP